MHLSCSHLLDWSMTSIESGAASASSLGWAGVPDVQDALEEAGSLGCFGLKPPDPRSWSLE